MNISQLGSLVNLINTNPNEAKALIKLVSVDILKSLGDGKYSVLLDNKRLTAQSDKPLSEGAKYWSQLTQTKDSVPQLSQLLKQPSLLKNLQHTNLEYSLKDLKTILSSVKPENILKQNILEHLSTATTKEEFSNASTLLLSLQNQTMTIPLNYHGYFSVLQFKKRYNKKTKKSQIDFYAALELLGPISGIISLENGRVSIELNVAFDKTKQFLENDMKNLSYEVDISVINLIEPLYNANINSLLDLCI
ncbi:hypothetical protein HUE87_05860 [Candidatus Sulfurimonas marisnigri]|uniref:Uncharacterized protein n=1 Tax=Candidatus Sulfurimonas marisnigri TaxID=2740405 RepID=A0A7S7M2A5_9BACT|nr:hypothetical protein [Candidatus Sulfurimonas marisnigri]QOY55749.1 hypothetical protein HUE87_05860 [Candidatus Sulfurimonas marisnigri]